MSFRTRIFLTSVLLVWVPLLVLAWVIRNGMSDRLSREHMSRVTALAHGAEQDLANLDRRLRERMGDLRAEILDDNQFRLAAVEGISPEPAFLPDYAGRIMKLAGLSVLQILDPSGRVLSSGHFRNEYGSRDTTVVRGLVSREGSALARFRRAEDRLLAMAHADSLPLAGRTFFLVGGIAVGRTFLSELAWEEEFSTSLIGPGFAISSDDSLNKRLGEGMAREGWNWKAEFPETRFLTEIAEIPFVLAPEGGRARVITATLVSAYNREGLQRTLLQLDFWLLAVILAALVGTWIASALVAVRISRPLISLAHRTSQIDLERTIEDFPVTRRDELGDLSRFLNAMTARLRSSTRKLRDMEREATRGELARQVNHDVRNGLTPIRNVISHLDQVAREEPGQLLTVWDERVEGLRSGLAYLEELGKNYAKLYRHHPRRPCDLNEVVREQAAAMAGDPQVRFATDLAEPLPRVVMDPTALRRILENLITNAREALDGENGCIVVKTWQDSREGTVGLSVEDDGPGISPEEQSRIFTGFYTTKEEGSGLGLLIVRRMVADAGGSIRVHSAVGEGTRFEVRFPPAPQTARNQ